MSDNNRLTTLFFNGLSELYGEDIPENLTFTQFMRDVNDLINKENKQ